jgi:hypothetical protein
LGERVRKTQEKNQKNPETIRAWELPAFGMAGVKVAGGAIKVVGMVGFEWE